MNGAEQQPTDATASVVAPAPDAPAMTAAPATSVAEESAVPDPAATAGPAPAEPRPSSDRPLVRVVGAPPPPETTRPPAEVALRSLPVAGVSRRRVAWVLGIAVSLWIVAHFARQVGDAAAAAARADRIRADNAALAATVTALQHERDVVQERSFIELQARAFGLGNARDQRFTLAPNAPPLPSDAPGSASLRLAPSPTPQTPLDSWLALLFGPSPQGH